MKNELTVDDKLLALLPAHSPTILSINKTINIEAARATNCKRLSCQESVQCCKHLVKVTQIAVLNSMDAVTSSKVVTKFQTVVNGELQHQLGSRNIRLGMTLYLPLSTACGSPIQAAACVTHLSSVSSVPTGHNEMC